MQWVLYMEVQGLYAAAARRGSQAAEGRPVVVLRDGRVYDGCRDAFAAGLVLGSPARQAARDVPRAQAVDLAELESEQPARAWWDQCLAHTPYIEPLAPHQLFLSLPSAENRLTAALKAEATKLVNQAATHGFVAFAGLAASKLTARAAALFCREGWLLWRPGSPGRTSRPETFRIVLPGEEPAFLAALPISYLPAPPDVQRRLARLGLNTIGEAAAIGEGEWLRQLGPAGRQVSAWSRGIDREPVKPAYPARTITREIAFAPEVRERDLLEQSLLRAASALSRQLTGSGEGCQQVDLALERGSGPPSAGAAGLRRFTATRFTATRTLARLQQGVYPLRQALLGLLDEAMAAAAGAGGWDGAVSALTVQVGLIGPMPLLQLDLWDDGGRSERAERLEQALSLLQERFPSRMVGLGPRRDISWREQMLAYNDPFRTGHFPGVERV